MESEQQLIERAAAAVSACDWTIGECASLWCRAYARGRTDADFGALVGMSGDQIFQRRRVWETFGDVRENHPNIKHKHFYVALTWNDAAECLAWADEQDATVAEMKAWRRMQRGEDLSTEASDDELPGDRISEPARNFEPASDPHVERGGSAVQDRTTEQEARRAAPSMMATLGDDSTDEAYAPFRTGAATATKPRPEDDAGDGATRDAVLIRKTCVTVGKVILKTDDARQFVTELLAECWRAAPGDTADAIKLFIQDKPLCQ